MPNWGCNDKVDTNLSVRNGMGGVVVFLTDGIGRKLMSNGRAPGSCGISFLGSTWTLEHGPMRLAVFRRRIKGGVLKRPEWSYAWLSWRH